jgi:hypothetical protein
MSSPAQTLGLRVQIPFDARISEFILCLRCPVQVAALRRANPPSKESYPLSIAVFLNRRAAAYTGLSSYKKRIYRAAV